MTTCTATTTFDGRILRCEKPEGHDQPDEDGGVSMHYAETDDDNALAWGELVEAPA